MHSARIQPAGLFPIALALTGCAPTEVGSYSARGVDLRAHRTYNWAPVSTTTGSFRIAAWYDNGSGYSTRLAETAASIAV